MPVRRYSFRPVTIVAVYSNEVKRIWTPQPKQRVTKRSRLKEAKKLVYNELTSISPRHLFDMDWVALDKAHDTQRSRRQAPPGVLQRGLHSLLLVEKGWGWMQARM